MKTPRISASSYSNTAPLVWSFLYGQNHGRVELILDNAPARSAELLAGDRVDAALVPVIAYQTLDGLKLVPDVCVGAKRGVRSVSLVTNRDNLADVKSVALDRSSRTSSVLTKVIFREFLGLDPEWRDAEPDLDAMLADCDAALLIGDPGLDPKFRAQNLTWFDLAAVWHEYTGLGFVFAMWMTSHDNLSIDFAAARDEGVAHIDEIAANYASEIGLNRDEMRQYLTENISYSIDDEMRRGMELYFDFAAKHGLINENKPLQYAAI